MSDEQIKKEAKKLADASDNMMNVVAKAIRFALQHQHKEINISLGFSPEMVPRSSKGVLSDKPFAADDYTTQGMCLLVVKTNPGAVLTDDMQKLVYEMESRRVSIGSLQDNADVFPVIFSVKHGEDLEELEHRDYCLFMRNDPEDLAVVECGRHIAQFLRSGTLPQS
jgi:hypothetical protein